MRAAQMKDRPNFTLMTQKNSCYMQMPRWLFSDPHYAVMSLNAKVAYTFLLNRFQLSRLNGWVNDQGEVFVVYPRKELSKELGICEQNVTSAFRELVNLNLVWEKRCGRGNANQIYLAKVNPQNDPDYTCAPFLPENGEKNDSRTAELEALDSGAEYAPSEKAALEEATEEAAGLDEETDEHSPVSSGIPTPNEFTTVNPVQKSGREEKTVLSAANGDKSDAQDGEQTPDAGQDVPIVSDGPDNRIPLERPNLERTPPVSLCVPGMPVSASGKRVDPVGQSFTPSARPVPVQEAQNMRFQSRSFGGSRTMDFAVAEPQILRCSKKDISNTEKSEKELSQSVSAAHTRTWTAAPQTTIQGDGLTDMGGDENLQRILAACELETFSPGTALVFENAIERLYYCQTFRVGESILPQSRVRSRLYLLDSTILREAECKLAANVGRKVRNTTAYTMAVIFNCIAEAQSDLLLDPYLNTLQGLGREGASCC